VTVIRPSASPGALLRLAGRPARLVRTLKRDAFSENHLVELTEGRFVLKRSRPLGFLARRERRNYERLAGVEGIPALGPVHTDLWFLHTWVEGLTLEQVWRRINERMVREERSRGEIPDRLVPDDFYLRLGRLVDALHARGVAYCDLTKRANVIVGPGGRPWLIDLQISAAFPPDRSRLASALFSALCRGDRYHVRKHARRHGLPAPEWPEDAATAGPAHHAVRAFWRSTWLPFRRSWLPREW
jgi:hypothetical protein